MRKSLVTKFVFFTLLFVILISLTNRAFSATQKQSNWLDDPININFENEPLRKLLNQIAQQTGVSIAYDQELANEKVTGNYQNIKTSDAITRLFRGKNKSIQVNIAKRIIIIKTFGAKSYIWADSTQKALGQKQSSGLIFLANLEELHAQQYKEYKERITDDSEVLDGGMTRKEIRIMQQQQNNESQKSIADDSDVFKGDMTQGEMEILHAQQYGEFKNDAVNNYEIRALHTTQSEEFKESLNNNTQLLNGEVSNSEIRDVHEKQYEEYQHTLYNAESNVR